MCNTYLSKIQADREGTLKFSTWVSQGNETQKGLISLRSCYLNL